jgi:hypothetical protein
MTLKINGEDYPVEWEDNESVEALKELCPLTVEMSMYGGFEQVGSLGTSLPRNDKQITTGYGDIVLYSGDQIVVFYGSNSWASVSVFQSGSSGQCVAQMVTASSGHGYRNGVKSY